jgi:hypothetical protein
MHFGFTTLFIIPLELLAHLSLNRKGVLGVPSKYVATAMAGVIVRTSWRQRPELLSRSSQQVSSSVLVQIFVSGHQIKY